MRVGDDLPHLRGLSTYLKPFYPYFRSMNDVASRNRFTDHEGSSHYINGTKGGQQGDPLEMLFDSACLCTQFWVLRRARLRAQQSQNDHLDAQRISKLPRP